MLTSKSDVMKSDFIATEDRSMRLEAFLTRITTLLPDIRIIALSAVAGGSEHFIAKWATNSADEQAITTAERTTRQIFGALEVRADGNSTVFLDMLDGKKLGLLRRRIEAYIPQPFPTLPRVTGNHKDTGNYTLCNVLWAAVHLSMAKRRTLISVTQGISRILARYRDLFEEQRDWMDRCPNFFEEIIDPTNQEIYQNCLVACEDYCGPDSHELFFLRRGIAVHHGQLPVKVRRLMVDVIRNGITPIAVATSTLTEGVNLPFDVILLPSILRFDGTVSKTIPTSEIKNLAGRAGRPGTSGEGIVLVGLTAEPTGRPGTARHATQTEEIQKRKREFRRLVNKINADAPGDAVPNDSPLKVIVDRIYETWSRIYPGQGQPEFVQWLEQTADDPSVNELDAIDSVDNLVLGAIEEFNSIAITELNEGEVEERLRLLWGRTYARFQAQDAAFYESVLISRGRSIFRGAHGDQNERRLLYQIGLPPRQGRAILGSLDGFEELLLRGTTYADNNLEERVQFLDELINSISQVAGFSIGADVENWRQMLRWWVRAPNFVGPDLDETKDWFDFASDYFEYRCGIFIGASLAKIWNRENEGRFQVPDLDQWQQVTGLPWAAFWLRDLLAWGVTEPVAAYMLSLGKTKSRTEALNRVPDYYGWADAQNLVGEP